MASQNLKGGWKSAITTAGEEFVETLGMLLKLQSFADSWDISTLVI